MDRTHADGPAIADRAADTYIATSTLTHRERRAASLRLPPAGDGPADPLDELAQLPIGPPQECHGVEYAGSKWVPCRCRGAA